MRFGIYVILPALIILATGYKQYSSDDPQKANVKHLMQTTLAEEFTPDRDILIDLVEIPPNTTLDWHRHPGEEFHYYMEGEVEIKIEGQPSIIGKPGGVGHVPFMKKHVAIAGNKGAKILVFRVHTKGKPWKYPEKG